MDKTYNNTQDVLIALDRLEETIRRGKKSMFGGGRLVEDIQCLAIIGDIRNALPSCVNQARVIVDEREEIIEDAKARADSIINDARRRAERMLDENEIIDKANAEADKIVAKAQQYADMLTHETLSSIDGMLADSEDAIRKILDVIRNSKADLEDMLDCQRGRR